MAYPNSLDSLSTTKADNTTMQGDHAAHHDALAAAVNAIEAELGILPKGGDASVRARLDKLNPSAPAAYTISNYTTKRTLNGSSFTLGDVMDVLCTTIADLKVRGIVG